MEGRLNVREPLGAEADQIDDFKGLNEGRQIGESSWEQVRIDRLQSCSAG